MNSKLQRIRDSLLWAFIVALGIRLLVLAFQYQGALNPARDHWAFGYEMGRIARAMLSGRGYADPFFTETGPTAQVTPLYPLVLAAIFKVFGIYTTASAVVILSLNCLFSALTCVPIYFIGHESFGPAVGGWATWAWALFPYAIFHSTNMIWDTCLTTLLLTCLFLATLRLQHPSGMTAWAGYGLLWGIAAMSNPAVLSVLPVLCGWACYRLHRQGHRSLARLALAGLVLAIVVFPWFARNYRTFHRFIPFRDTFWIVFDMGNRMDALSTDRQGNQPASDLHELDQFDRMGEMAYVAKKRDQGIEFIHEHPGMMAWLSVRRIVNFWTGFWSFPSNGTIEERFDPDDPFDPAFIIFCTACTILALAGLWWAFAHRLVTAWLYVLVLLVFPLPYYLTETFERYHHLIGPEIVVLAVYAIVSWSRDPASKVVRYSDVLAFTR
jgi:4-amino-4-deoxy-L-arabinose transferase-like glycosyltransferase